MNKSKKSLSKICTTASVRNLGLLVLLVFLSCKGYAQYGVAKEYSGKMHEGFKDGYQILLVANDGDKVLKTVKKELRQYAGKTKNQKGGVAAEELQIAGADGLVNAYFQVKSVEDNEMALEAYVFAAGTTLRSPTVKSWLDKFGSQVANTVLSEQLDGEADELKDLQKDLNGFVKDIDGAKDEIKDCQQKIAEAEALISEREANIDKAKDQIKEKERFIKDLEKKKSAIK